MINTTKTAMLSAAEYIKALVKWVVISVIVGLVCGTVGVAFHKCVEIATEMRVHDSRIILLLPLGGLIIVAIYKLTKTSITMGTNLVIESIRTDKKIPFFMAPLIFISTVITHLFGGSAGREGAALQLGGSIGYKIGKLFRLNEKDTNIIIMIGMSSVFSALFGTPLTAAFFVLEVVNVGAIHYVGLVPCLVSAFVSFLLSTHWGTAPVKFDFIVAPQISVATVGKVILLGILCALVSILFCAAMKKGEHIAETYIKNDYLRIFAGGVIIVGLTLLLGTTDYNGAGMDVIERALSGQANPWAFLLKILFTVITISVGFKGGEIVPTFFIGSTFGCVAGTLLGMDPGFAAALGFVGMFCCVVNCPVSSIILALEVFGGESILLFAFICAVGYMMSGYYGLYGSQKIVYSKLKNEIIDRNTR